VVGEPRVGFLEDVQEQLRILQAALEGATQHGVALVLDDLQRVAERPPRARS
jgi:hypothetical protein